MKKITSYTFVTVCFLFLTFSCNKENNDINISKKECLKYIRQDISNGKYYPNEKI